MLYNFWINRLSNDYWCISYQWSNFSLWQKLVHSISLRRPLLDYSTQTLLLVVYQKLNPVLIGFRFHTVPNGVRLSKFGNDFINDDILSNKIPNIFNTVIIDTALSWVWREVWRKYIIKPQLLRKKFYYFYWNGSDDAMWRL